MTCFIRSLSVKNSFAPSITTFMFSLIIFLFHSYWLVADRTYFKPNICLSNPFTKCKSSGTKIDTAVKCFVTEVLTTLLTSFLPGLPAQTKNKSPFFTFRQHKCDLSHQRIRTKLVKMISAHVQITAFLLLPDIVCLILSC